MVDGIKEHLWMMEAYFGTISNDECRIDSLAQSWSVISGAGDNDKKYISMESLENHLIDREYGIIKLLDPPFDKGNLEPRIYKRVFARGKRKWWTIYSCSNLGYNSIFNAWI